MDGKRDGLGPSKTVIVHLSQLYRRLDGWVWVFFFVTDSHAALQGSSLDLLDSHKSPLTCCSPCGSLSTPIPQLPLTSTATVSNFLEAPSLQDHPASDSDRPKSCCKSCDSCPSTPSQRAHGSSHFQVLSTTFPAAPASLPQISPGKFL